MKKIIRPKEIWDPGNRYAQGILDGLEAYFRSLASAEK